PRKDLFSCTSLTTFSTMKYLFFRYHWHNLPALYNDATGSSSYDDTNYERHDNDPEHLPAKFEEQGIFRNLAQQYLYRHIDQSVEGQPLTYAKCLAREKRNWHVADREKER